MVTIAPVPKGAATGRAVRVVAGVAVPLEARVAARAPDSARSSETGCEVANARAGRVAAPQHGLAPGGPADGTVTLAPPYAVRGAAGHVGVAGTAFRPGPPLAAVLRAARCQPGVPRPAKGPGAHPSPSSRQVVKALKASGADAFAAERAGGKGWAAPRAQPPAPASGSRLEAQPARLVAPPALVPQAPTSKVDAGASVGRA